MACECFQDERWARCSAVAGHVVPSLHEREHYCRSDGFQACPTYRLYQLRGARLSEEAYLALWVTPVPEPPAAVAPAESPPAVV